MNYKNVTFYFLTDFSNILDQSTCLESRTGSINLHTVILTIIEKVGGAR